MHTLLCLLALSLSPAHAAKQPMWGVGGSLGTVVLPGAYPLMFPPAVEDIDKVRGDVTLNGEGMYYLDKTNRVGGMLGGDFGSGYRDLHIIAKYDRMVQFDALDGFIGGGLGLGSSRWTGKDAAQVKVPNYPLRAEAGFLYHKKTWAVQATAFAQYNWPSTHYYTNANGVEEDVGTGIYALMGVEVGGYYGNFKQKNKSSKKSSSKSGKKSSTSGSSSTKGRTK